MWYCGGGCWFVGCLRYVRRGQRRRSWGGTFACAVRVGFVLGAVWCSCPGAAAVVASFFVRPRAAGSASCASGLVGVGVVVAIRLGVRAVGIAVGPRVFVFHLRVVAAGGLLVCCGRLLLGVVRGVGGGLVVVVFVGVVEYEAFVGVGGCCSGSGGAAGGGGSGVGVVGFVGVFVFGGGVVGV